MTEKKKEQKETPDPAMEKAMNSGWVPKEEYNGEGEWVDYKEFNFRGELMGRINEQSSIINHLKEKVTLRDKVVDDMAELNSKIAKKAYDDAVRDLKKQKAEALENDDYEAVVEADEQLTELKDNKPQPIEVPEVTPQEQVPKEITDWMAKPENRWYHENQTLRSMADGIADGILKSNPETPPATLLEKVDEALRRELPHRFKNTNSQDVDQGGEYNGTRRRSKAKPTFADLDPEMQAIARRFEKQGVKTIPEYIDDLIEIGEL